MPAAFRTCRSGRLALRIAALVTVVVFAGTAAAQSLGILDGVRLSDDSADTIVIDFSEPARYVNQALSPSGTALQVRLIRLAALTGDGRGGSGRVSLVASGRVAHWVTDIAFQSNSGDGGTLTVHFARAVRATAGQGADPRSISITVAQTSDQAHDGSAGESAAPAAESVAAPAATPAASASAPANAGPQHGRGGGAAPLPVPPPPDASGPAAAEMEEARRAMVAKDYAAAIRLLTKVVQSGNPTTKQEAQELLGVAQERSNHLAHAKAEYEEYLKLYPTGEGADRVRQRLAALVGTARESGDPAQVGAPPSANAKALAPARPPISTYLAGSFAQFFRRDSGITTDQGPLINQSYLVSDLDLAGRVRTEDYDIRGLVDGGYRLDIEGGSSSSSDLRMRYLYLDFTDRPHGVNARLGRQSLSTGGVLGRFDGALLSYRATPRTRLNAVTGFPVDLSSWSTFTSDTLFYGLSVDYGPFADYWAVNGFAIQQTANGMLDRRAIGGEVRYLRPEASFFTFVDYDISYLNLNILLMQGTYFFPNAATVGIAFDYRDAPILTTSNALIGQPVDSLDELDDTYDEDEIRALAEDRTQRSWSATLSGSYPLTDRIQLAADGIVADLSDTPESGGVLAIPPTGTEYTVSTQLIGNEIFLPRDIQIGGVRYAHTSFADTGSLFANSLFLVGEGWRWNPRFQVDLQGRDGGMASILRPALLVDYRWMRALSFEFEAGYEWVAELSGDIGGSRQGYYLYCGYRWDFEL